MNNDDLITSTKNLFLFAAKEVFPNFSNSFNVSFSSSPEHGDITTNIAMILASQMKKKPGEVGNMLLDTLNVTSKDKINSFQKIEIHPAGFINLTLKEEIWPYTLRKMIKQDIHYKLVHNISALGESQKVNIEYVSANPTGYLHIGNARGAVYGDIIANLLSFCGFEVVREYYINDYGNQIDILVQSVLAKYREKIGIDAVAQDDFYKGEYIRGLANNLYSKHGSSLVSKDEEKVYEIISSYCIDTLMQTIKEDLNEIGVNHDKFVSEKNDIRKNFLSKALKDLDDKGLSYRGYLEKPKGDTANDEEWQERELTLFKAKEYGDNTDRVILKNDGTATYFALDIAYHKHKIDRGFNKIILVLGIDHTGYAARIKAVVKALSNDTVDFKVLFTNMVYLLNEDNIQVTMSKRSGNFIRLKDLNESIGKDILRFYMISRKNDSVMELNIKNAKEQSYNNPIFYIQYAHTRAFSIISKAHKMGIISQKEVDIYERNGSLCYHNTRYLEANEDYLNRDSMISLHYIEKSIIKKISELPEIIKECTNTFELHVLAYYAYDLATLFHSLWNIGITDKRMKFLSAENKELSDIRIDLVYMVARTMGRVLNIMGITPLTEM